MIERKLGDNILNALQVLPVVYVNGPRQAGKSTLVQKLAKKQWPAEYITFDEATLLGAASSNPESFLRSFQNPVILDEVQMVPELFRVLKLLVDEVRINDKVNSNGNFLLTGSANIMALPQLSDALVGRMSVLTLFPLSAVEVNNGKGNFISQLLQNKFKPEKINRKFKLSDIIRRATFPEITDSADASRRQWFESYMTTILQRDVRQIAEISKLAVLPNLLRILAGRAGGLINEADISRAIGQNAVTAKNYRILLQMMFLTFDVKPWYRNISKRLVKAPKGYFVDTSLLCHLQQIDVEKTEINNPHIFGYIFENFVASELIKQLSWMSNAPTLFHFRTSDGKEVDFILENPDGTLVAIEVKGRDSVNAEDFRGLKELHSQIKEDFICGIVIYRGDKVVPFDNNLWAVPVDLMWA